MIDATTEVEVGVDCRGNTIVRRMRCEVPMLVRVVGEPGPVLSLAMVSGAAGPFGGDRLRFRLRSGCRCAGVGALGRRGNGPTGAPWRALRAHRRSRG